MNAILHEELVRRCIAGNTEAQYEFYQQYAKAMFGICLRMMKDSAAAEDALQDAFVSAFRKLHQFKGESTVGAWLKRIVVNTCLTQLRKRSIEIIPQTAIEEMPLAADSLEEQGELTLEVERVKAAIQELPNGFRIVLSLYLLEGYDHKEIAEILEITESTSKSQYNRAKKKLRAMLSS